ncbi:FecR family protein [Pseudomonas syringae]|uniref:Peptide ABC transporter substrate-binding protein n=1 Tax=Pseudomonas syringae TaxID=317 RepID=A0A085V7C1_PSESX|nr:FecR family protein [Pseudomonas syringae]KFE51334.1 peptide ABC transporter substrate-binding protein [Pseudomonas syringae]
MSDPILSEAEHDAVTDAAAHWCMRLHASDCTTEERKAFERWHNGHPLHAFEFEAMLEIWDTAEQIVPVNPAPAHHAATPDATIEYTPPSSRWRSYAAAAAVALLAFPIAGYVGWNQGWIPNSYDTYEAGDATRLVTMADGSRVELNLGTALSFANYKDRRSVVLNKGEAFFEVSHDSQHPFVVDAGKGQIKVTGTKFNVWMYQDQVKVMLVEGSVKVVSDTATPSRGYRLEPGMQASYKTGDVEPQVSETYSNDSSLTWRNGKLVINDLPLTQALPLINRYLPQPILLADKATGAMRLGGSYNTRDMAGLLASLPKVLPVTVTRNQDGNPVINRRPGSAPKG